jgi:hypothetical protein
MLTRTGQFGNAGITGLTRDRQMLFLKPEVSYAGQPEALKTLSRSGKVYAFDLIER